MKPVDELSSPDSHRAVVQDGLFLSLVVLLSLVLYIKGLGFYYDDYAYLNRLIAANDQSFIGLTQTLYLEEVNTRMRPTEVVYLAGLYWLVGPYPLAYHVANALVLLSGIVLFYFVLREMGQPRLLTLTIPLVYALLPHYSTDRFWVVASPHTLSITLYFLCVYADLRALRDRLAHLWRWKLIGLLSLLGSGLAYEVALPLFVLNPFLIWHRAQQLYGRVLGHQLVRRHLAILLASNLLLVALVLGFKVVATSALAQQTGLQLGVKTSYVQYVGFLVTEAIRINYITYGIGLLYVVWRALQLAPNWMTIIGSGLVGLIIFAYLWHVAKRREASMPSLTSWLGYLMVGLVVFALGYAVFLSTDRIVFSSAGIDNRVAIAAAIGVALSFVGVLGGISALLPSHRCSKVAFCTLVALLCASGCLIINTVAAFWMTAYRQQQDILADLLTHVPVLPKGTTLILDGVCPEIGPAVIFKSHYDVTGALIMAYGDASLRADVATPSFTLEKQGLTIRQTLYPYDERLLLYNFERQTLHPMTDRDTASHYAQTFNSDRDCPPGSWGWRTGRP